MVTVRPRIWKSRPTQRNVDGLRRASKQAEPKHSGSPSDRASPSRTTLSRPPKLPVTFVAVSSFSLLQLLAAGFGPVPTGFGLWQRGERVRILTVRFGWWVSGREIAGLGFDTRCFWDLYDAVAVMELLRRGVVLPLIASIVVIGEVNASVSFWGAWVGPAKMWVGVVLDTC